MKIAIVIPCFKSKKTILAILKKIDKSVKKILIIDDCCPEKTGRYIISKVKDSRIQVIFNKKNLGVGGAVLTGFKFLKYQNIDVIVKLDSDGQMNPENIIGLIKPILLSKADYTKGNRFYSFTNIFKMPKIRMLGNIILNFITKISTGYYSVQDPTNGFFAIKKDFLFKINFKKLKKNYFFETSMLFNLYLLRARISHYNMKTKYFKGNVSSLSIPRVIPYFLKGHFLGFVKRLSTNNIHIVNLITMISFFVISNFLNLNIFFYLIPASLILFFIVDFANEPR